MNWRLLVPTLLLASTQGTFANECVRITCGKDSACLATPSRLIASLPPGFEIRSIRGDTKIATRGEAGLVDCRPESQLSTTVSADQVSIYGAVYVAGKLQTSGVIRFEPNDGGELEFRPGKQTFRATGNFFKTNFARIKLDEAQPAVRIAPPQSLAKADCWQANATAELSDFSVVIGDTSAVGTYARQARITQVEGFAKCTWGGE